MDTNEWVIERESLSTRNFVSNEIEAARENECDVINLEQVEFVSGAVADELVHLATTHDLQLINKQDMVAEMINMIHERRERVSAE